MSQWNDIFININLKVILVSYHEKIIFTIKWSNSITKLRPSCVIYLTF